MTKHYSEADLLEAHYGESTPATEHLMHCAECSARYERLERKLRDAAACPSERPEEFFARQRMSIMRKVEFGADRRPSMTRVAAAAVLALVLGGLVFYRSNEPPIPTPPALDVQVPNDPWDAEPLREFGSVVEWEEWLIEGGEQS